MGRKLSIIRKLIYWCSITHILLFLFTISLGQALPIEFTDSGIKDDFYRVILGWIPLSVLLTLTGINRRTDRILVINRCIITPLFSIISLLYTVSLMFTVGFGSWVDQQMLYQQKARPEIRIVSEIRNDGVLGYGGYRRVKITPFTPLFQMVQEVDTLVIDPSNRP